MTDRVQVCQLCGIRTTHVDPNGEPLCSEHGGTLHASSSSAANEGADYVIARALRERHPDYKMPELMAWDIVKRLAEAGLEIRRAIPNSGDDFDPDIEHPVHLGKATPEKTIRVSTGKANVRDAIPNSAAEPWEVERAAAHANGDLSRRGYGLPQSEAVQFLTLALRHLDGHATRKRVAGGDAT